MSTLVSLSLLLVAVLCLVSAKMINPPKCSETIIAKIVEYCEDHEYPEHIVPEGSEREWTILHYSVDVESPVCVKQDFGDKNMTSTGLNTETKEVTYLSVVLFKGDIEKGFVKETVLCTGGTNHVYMIKSTKDIKAYYMCNPDSTDTETKPQGGVSVPIGADEHTVKEAKAMKDILAEIGIETYDITPCKE